MFDGFTEIEKKGAGGLGNLYRARRETTGGVVAIKELRDVGAGSPTMHRARRELEALLRLKGHPYVVSIEEIIEGPEGPCLVMEFAEGGSLMDRLEQGGPLPAAELVLVGQHVAQALTVAHRLGIVHRDVKPHNLLIGTFGQVKLCDFGIAALTRDSSDRTQTQAITLAYASPEELDGADEIGPPADVYSFAATFLHLATGRRPTFRERIDAAALQTLASEENGSVMAAVYRGLAAAFTYEPEGRPTMAELSVLFDETAFLLGKGRIQSLVVPRPSAAAPPPDDLATVIRPRQPRAAQPPATGPVSAGWFADPSGRHEGRYWAGAEWTEHVNTRGVGGMDPPTVSGAAVGSATSAAASCAHAGWFVDPGRRHELRYWDGAMWTEHVHTSGAAYRDDPIV